MHQTFWHIDKNGKPPFTLPIIFLSYSNFLFFLMIFLMISIWVILRWNINLFLMWETTPLEAKKATFICNSLMTS
jgi:hypothetical protein